MNYIKGDLLIELVSGTVDVILHVAICQRIMGSGIALQIKNKYPGAYKAYMEYPSQPLDCADIELGTISYHQLYGDGAYIFNLHAQHLYGYGKRFLNYEALYCSLEKARDVITKSGLMSASTIKIGVPKFMGCYRAGGSWKVVSSMLEDVLEDKGFDVTVVDFDGKDP